jgi:hypothetical protein
MLYCITLSGFVSSWPIGSCLFASQCYESVRSFNSNPKVSIIKASSPLIIISMMENNALRVIF